MFLVFSCSLIVVTRLAFKTCLPNDISIVSISQRYGHTSKGSVLFIGLTANITCLRYSYQNYSIRISFSCIIILTSYVFLLYKKRTLLFKFVYRWKLKILGSLKIFWNYNGDIGFAITYNFRVRFVYSIPHIYRL